MAELLRKGEAASCSSSLARLTVPAGTVHRAKLSGIFIEFDSGVSVDVGFKINACSVPCSLLR